MYGQKLRHKQVDKHPLGCPSTKKGILHALVRAFLFMTFAMILLWLEAVHAVAGGTPSDDDASATRSSCCLNGHVSAGCP